MYTPSDDTLLLLDCLRPYRGRSALEIGVGSCLIADSLLKTFEIVVGTDLDIAAIKFCKSIGSKVFLLCCDGPSAVRGSFDLIVSNPPYLPDDHITNASVKTADSLQIHDKTIHGGPKGVEVTIRFVQASLPLLAPSGRMLFVISSYSAQDALDAEIENLELEKRVVRSKSVFFETLSVIEIKRKKE